MCELQAVDTEKRLCAVQEENKREVNMDPVPTNDLEYEDKQKSQESQLVYDGLRFNLLAHCSKPTQYNNAFFYTAFIFIVLVYRVIK